MIDHLSIAVRDLEVSGRFYEAVLATLGYSKLIARAQETLNDPEASGFTVRRLEMTRNSLSTTLRQVASRLKANI